MNGIQGKNLQAGTEAETHGRMLLTGFPPMACSFYFLIQLRIYAQGWHHSVVWALPHQS